MKILYSRRCYCEVPEESPLDADELFQDWNVVVQKLDQGVPPTELLQCLVYSQLSRYLTGVSHARRRGLHEAM